MLSLSASYYKDDKMGGKAKVVDMSEIYDVQLEVPPPSSPLISHPTSWREVKAPKQISLVSKVGTHSGFRLSKAGPCCYRTKCIHE